MLIGWDTTFRTNGDSWKRAGGRGRTPAVCGCASRRFVLQSFFLGIPTWFSVFCLFRGTVPLFPLLLLLFLLFFLFLLLLFSPPPSSSSSSSSYSSSLAQRHVRHHASHIYLKAAIKSYLLKPNKFDTMSWPYHLVKKSFLLKFDFGLDLSWFDFACERTNHGEGLYWTVPTNVS